MSGKRQKFLYSSKQTFHTIFANLSSFSGLTLNASVCIHVLLLVIISTCPKDTAACTIVADEKQSCNEDYTANCTWFAFQKKARQVEYNEHTMVIIQSRIHWLWYQQNRYQPLKTVHF